MSARYSHSIGKQYHKDGSYTICESYRDGRGVRWSKTYTSWDNQWTYRGDHPKASRSKGNQTSTRIPPKKISTAAYKQLWVKNPFFEP